MNIKLLLIILLQISLPSLSLAEESIKIGLLTDTSGLASYWGKQTSLGAKLAEKELNSKGIPLKVFYEDHGLQAKNSVSAVQKLIFADKVDAIFSEFTTTTLPASPIAKNNKKLFLASCAAESFLERNPYAFKTYVDYKAGCQAVATYWKKEGVTKVALLKANTEYGELCFTGLKRVFPNAKSIDYAYGQEVRTQALLLKKMNAEAILNASFEGDITNMMEAFSTISFKPRVAANFDAITEAVVERYGKIAEEFVSFGFKSVNSHFIAKIKAIDPENSLVAIEGAAQAYIHIKQMTEAISACQKNDIICQTKKFAESKAPTDSVLGFKNFKQRQAVFALELKKWKLGVKSSIKDVSY